MRQILSNAAALAAVLLVSTGILAELHAQTSKPASTAAPAASQPAKGSTQPAGGGGKGSANGAGKAAASGGGVVNINTATAEQLQSLPGVGAKTAARILDYRQKRGAFKKVEELMNVQGIGEKSFIKLRPQVTVGAVAP